MINNLSMFTKKHNIGLLLMIILMTGIILRFYGLTVQSYWVDELFTLSTANPSATFLESVDKVLRDLVHPPVYNVLLWVWFKIFGFTEYAGRSFSAFVGSLSIIAIYYLGKETFNKKVGLYAALIVALNYFLIYFSQEARSYILFFLLTILSYLFLFKSIRTKKMYHIILYTFFTLLLLYTHYFAFFLVASQFLIFIYFILISRTERKNLIYMGAFPFIVIALSVAPLLYNILNSDSTIAAKNMAWCHAPTPYFFLSYMKDYFSYQVILFAMLWLLLAVKIYQKKIKNIHIVYTLIIWIFICYFLPYVKSMISYPILANRYTIYVLPAMILLVAVAVDSIENKKIKYIVLALIVFLSFHRLYKYDYYTKPVKEEWRKIAKHVIADPDNFPIYTKYYNQGHTEHFNTYFRVLKSKKRALPLAQLAQELESGNTPSNFWIIEAHGKNLLTTPLISKYSLNKVKEIKGIQAIGVLYKQ